LQAPPPHLGTVKVPALAVTTAAGVSSDSDASRKRGNEDLDDGNGSSSKRPCVEVMTSPPPPKDFDQAIAEIVAVIDDESKMLGRRRFLYFRFFVGHLFSCLSD
jgi:hypothetical protein